MQGVTSVGHVITERRLASRLRERDEVLQQVRHPFGSKTKTAKWAKRSALGVAVAGGLGVSYLLGAQNRWMYAPSDKRSDLMTAEDLELHHLKAEPKTVNLFMGGKATAIPMRMWFISHKESERSAKLPLIVMCAGRTGNGRNFDHRLLSFSHAVKPAHVRFLWFDYFGYYDSRYSGKISEALLNEQCARLLGEVLTESTSDRYPGIDYKRVILYGYSMGSVVASFAAQQAQQERYGYQVHGLVLDNPIHSADELARHKIGRPHRLIRPLIRFDFDVRRHMQDVHIPTLVFGSYLDKITPLEQQAGQLVNDLRKQDMRRDIQFESIHDGDHVNNCLRGRWKTGLHKWAAAGFLQRELSTKDLFHDISLTDEEEAAASPEGQKEGH